MRLIGLLVSVLLTTLFGQREIPMEVNKGTVTLIVNSIHTNITGGVTVGSILEGAVRNDTGVDFLYLRFQLIAYNNAGQDLKMCDRSNIGATCDFMIFDPIRAGEVVQLKSPGNIFYPDRDIGECADPRCKHKISPIARIAYRVTESPYRVKYTITCPPVVNEQFTISSVFSTSSIVLEFRSVGDLVEILWDQSVYIDETGNASRLIKRNVSLTEKDRPQPNTVIPPGTKLQETVFPIDRIKQDAHGSLSQASLLPDVVDNGSREKDLSLLIGKEVKLFLRLLVNDHKENITIPFKIVGVEY